VIKRLVDENAHAYPERIDEWRATLLAMRDYAAVDGALPPELDGLVREVFEPLLRR
jgi:hypothetical protein